MEPAVGDLPRGAWRLGVRWGAGRGQLETGGVIRPQEPDRSVFESDCLHLLGVIGSFTVSF